MIRSTFVVWLICFNVAAAGQDQGAEVITDILVEGNGKVESDAIKTIIQSGKGDRLDPEVVREDISTLYELGFFSDIRFFREPADGGVRLVIQVVEKPSIMEISFEGMEEVTEEDVKEKLETKLYTIVNESTIKNDLRMIEKQYTDKGYYLARASYDLVSDPNSKHEVKLVYKVDEGGEVKVGDVFIEGNEFFTDGELIGRFFSQPLTRSSAYSTPGSVFQDDFVKRDLEILAFLYKDQGFAKVKVAQPIMVMDPDRQFVRITHEVEEGLQYNVGTIDITGDLLYPKEELLEAMLLKSGDLFRYSRFSKDIEMLVDKYGDKGYAFVDVNPIPTFHDEKKTVDLNYEITKGEKVYFGKMTIVGNTKTRDNVIRRELEVTDGALYSGTRMSKSKRQVERLGFFEEVQSIKKRDQENTTILHYKFKVKEKPTGQLQAAIGFSPGRGTSENNWFGQGKYNEENQSGKGWKTSLTGRWNGGNNYSLDLGFTDPRVNDSHWSLGFGAFWRNEVRKITEGISIQEKTIGGNVTLGRRIFELVRGFLTYEIQKITQDSDGYIMARLKEEGIDSAIIFGLSRNDTDNYLDPTEGSNLRLSQRISGGPLLAGDRQYMETAVTGDYYYPVDFSETYRTYFKFGANYRMLHPYGNQPIPFYKRYRMGGPEDLRGYDYYDIGPRYNVLRSPGEDAKSINYGGTKRILFQLEYFLPIIPDANIKGLLFTDAGRVYADDQDFEFADFKRDVGFGFRWITPIAPFRFEWAYPYENGRLGELEFVFYLGY